MHNVINFYSMKNCGFCQKAKQILAPQIKQGVIAVHDSKDAPARFNFRGFPAFEYQGRTSMGYPKSFQELAKKLGYAQQPHQAQQPIINLYSLDHCGFCHKAKQILAPQIQKGMVVVKDAKEAPPKYNFTGFPSFEFQGKTSTGCPESFQKLLEALGLQQQQEQYQGPTACSARRRPRVENYQGPSACVRGSRANSNYDSFDHMTAMHMGVL